VWLLNVGIINIYKCQFSAAYSWLVVVLHTWWWKCLRTDSALWIPGVKLIYTKAVLLTMPTGSVSSISCTLGWSLIIIFRFSLMQGRQFPPKLGQVHSHSSLYLFILPSLSFPLPSSFPFLPPNSFSPALPLIIRFLHPQIQLRVWGIITVNFRSGVRDGARPPMHLNVFWVGKLPLVVTAHGLIHTPMWNVAFASNMQASPTPSQNPGKTWQATLAGEWIHTVKQKFV